jgi:hypothetical protein
MQGQKSPEQHDHPGNGWRRFALSTKGSRSTAVSPFRLKQILGQGPGAVKLIVSIKPIKKYDQYAYI